MNDNAPPIRELLGDERQLLRERATQTAYYSRLLAFLDDHRDVDVPHESVRAFEREDGLQAISFSDCAADESLPNLAVSLAFSGDKVVEASAERRDENGNLEMIFPDEFAPDAEEASKAIPQPKDTTIDLSVTEFDDVVVYLFKFHHS